MNAHIYLYFEGQAEAAAEFYRHTLGAEILDLRHYRDGPEQLKGMYPECDADKVMYLGLKIGDLLLRCSDGLCSGKPAFSGFALSLIATDQAEAERLINLLTEGGKVKIPLTRTFFSPAYGTVVDRFGVEWIVHVEN
jgi:PhnB protein